MDHKKKLNANIKYVLFETNIYSIIIKIIPKKPKVLLSLRKK